MLSEMVQMPGQEACRSLGRGTGLFVHAQGTRAATFLAAVPCARHVTLGVVQLLGRKLVAAEALASVLGSCNTEAASGTEGDACFVGDVGAVEVAPLGKRARIDGVDEATGVGETRSRRRWCRGGLAGSRGRLAGSRSLDQGVGH
jgi:hypothetical protein